MSALDTASEISEKLPGEEGRRLAAEFKTMEAVHRQGQGKGIRARLGQGRGHMTTEVKSDARGGYYMESILRRRRQEYSSAWGDGWMSALDTAARMAEGLPGEDGRRLAAEFREMSAECREMEAEFGGMASGRVPRSTRHTGDVR